MVVCDTVLTFIPGGIDIREAQERMRKQDVKDKQLFNERIKQKRKVHVGACYAVYVLFWLMSLFCPILSHCKSLAIFLQEEKERVRALRKHRQEVCVLYRCSSSLAVGRMSCANCFFCQMQQTCLHVHIRVFRKSLQFSAVAVTVTHQTVMSLMMLSHQMSIKLGRHNLSRNQMRLLVTMKMTKMRVIMMSMYTYIITCIQVYILFAEL